MSRRSPGIRAAIAVLAGAGLLLSVRSTRTIRSLSRRAAGGDRTAAAHFTQTRYARLFGVRNSDLGLLYYGGLLLAALSGTLFHRRINRALRAAAWGATCTSVLLIASLIRLRVWCRICLQAHAINFALLFLLQRAVPERRAPH